MALKLYGVNAAVIIFVFVHIINNFNITLLVGEILRHKVSSFFHAGILRNVQLERPDIAGEF